VVLADAVPQMTLVELTPRTIVANATMLPTIFDSPLIEGVYWTLEIEIRFYALIFLLLITRQMHRVELWLWAWLAVCVIASFREMPWIVRYLTLDPYGPFFIAGCFFYLVFAGRATAGRVAALILCCGLCAFVASTHRSAFITADRISSFVVPAITMVFFAVFGLMLRFRNRLVVRESVTRQLGELTYPLYLTHATMGLLVYTLLRPQIGIASALVVVIALALLVAWVITKAVDIPARKPLSAFLTRMANAVFRPGRPALAAESVAAADKQADGTRTEK
jgi:peptidoglycan/LPS O-acetylase OafA/YrhL